MNVKLLQKLETGPFEAGSYCACLIVLMNTTGQITLPAPPSSIQINYSCTLPARSNRLRVFDVVVCRELRSFTRACNRLCLRYSPEFDASASHHFVHQDGDPCRIRTCDRPLRRRVLYPAELRGRLRACLNPNIAKHKDAIVHPPASKQLAQRITLSKPTEWRACFVTSSSDQRRNLRQGTCNQLKSSGDIHGAYEGGGYAGPQDTPFGAKRRLDAGWD